MGSHGPLFGAMLQEFEDAATRLKLDPGIWRILTHPRRQVVVSCPVLMDSGEIQVFTGFRVQYNSALGPGKGGIRFHPGVSLDEVSRAAQSMPGLRTAMLDVRNAAEIESLVASLPSLHHVVNCAGIIKRGAEHDPEVFADVVNINLTGTMRICAGGSPSMRGWYNFTARCHA